MHGKFRMLTPITKSFAGMRLGRRTRERRETDAAAIIGAAGGQHAGPGETFDGVGMEPELSRHLGDGEPSGAAQMVVEALDAVDHANMAHPYARKWLTGPGAQKPCVECARHFGVDLLCTERTDLFHDGGRRAPKIWSALGQGLFDLRGGPAFPANLDLDGVATPERDVLDEQAQHALALSGRRARVVPHLRQVRYLFWD